MTRSGSQLSAPLQLPAYVTNQWAAVKDRGVELGVMRVYDP